MDLRRLRSEIAAVRQWQGQGGQGDPSDLYRAYTASPRHAAVGAEPKAEAEADRSILRDISAQRRRVLAMRDVSRCESRRRTKWCSRATTADAVLSPRTKQPEPEPEPEIEPQPEPEPQRPLPAGSKPVKPVVSGTAAWKEAGRVLTSVKFVSETTTGKTLLQSEIAKRLASPEAELRRSEERAAVETTGLYVERPEIGTTILVIAAELGDPAAVRARLATGANPDTPREDGLSPLYLASVLSAIAAARGQPRRASRYRKCVAYLAAAGAQVDCVGKEGLTPLILAAKNGDWLLLRQLKAAGGDPLHASTRGITAVMAATVMGHAEVLEWLLGPAGACPYNPHFTNHA